VARGLDLDAASAQTGIPVEQLHDLESGTVDRLPDRVAVLKALSRYAAFLELPGEQFVMTLVEHWPTVAGASAPAVVVHNGQALGSPVGAPVNAAAGRPDDLSTRAIPLTRHEDRATSVGLPVVEGRHSSTAQVPTVMADTGVTPAVRRRLPSDGLLMVLVRSLVVVASLLVALGTAWLVINRVHPQWLADLRLPYTSSGVGSPAVAGQTAATTTTTTARSTPAAASRTHPALQLLSANGSQASFSVSTPLFAVRISAQGGDTWVSASGPLSSQPTFEGIVKSGQSQLVSANHQLTVQIGSTAARVAVQVNSRVIGTYVPPGAPFTMTFTTP
jgi:cytoskeletal protein RodZ